jgi:hypothetical protein
MRHLNPLFYVAGTVLLGSIFACGESNATRTAPPSSPAATAPKPADLTPLGVFTTSAFCKQYGCANHKSWALKTGATNHSYDLNLPPAVPPSVGIEVPTKDERIESYGISFSDRERLDEADLQAIDALLRTIDAPSATSAVRQFVRTNIERDAFQILKAKSTKFGRYRLWAGKVGNDQIVHIEPITQ